MWCFLKTTTKVLTLVLDPQHPQFHQVIPRKDSRPRRKRSMSQSYRSRKILRRFSSEIWTKRWSLRSICKLCYFTSNDLGMTSTMTGLSLLKILESWCLTCLSTGMCSCRMCSRCWTTRASITSTRAEWPPQIANYRGRRSERGFIRTRKEKTLTTMIGSWTRKRSNSLLITYSRVALQAVLLSIWTSSSMSISTKRYRQKCSIH